MKTLVVLAGGKATRLGPLAHGNKALLSVGARPMIAYHYEFARKHYDMMIVVAPPGGVLRDVIGQMEVSTPIVVVDQPEPKGDLDAIRIGFTAAAMRSATDVSVVFADSLYDDLDEVKPCGWPARAYVTETRVERTWTYWDKESGHWKRGGYAGQHVFTGLMHLTMDQLPFIFKATSLEDFMTMASLHPQAVTSWHDVGDPKALISRSYKALSPPKRAQHSLRLTVSHINPERALVRKTGVSSEEIELMSLPSGGIVPPVVRTGNDHGNWYETPFLEMENLGELWTYWPLDAGMREWLTDRLMLALETLWGVEEHGAMTQAEWLERMLIHKPVERLRDWDAPVVASVHGRRIRKNLLHDLLLYIKDEVIPHYGAAQAVSIHGDPNITNVLISLRSDEVRIVDRRQDFGAPLYDMAKVWYSPRFARIVHGLVRTEQSGDDWSYFGSVRNLRFPDWVDVPLLHVRAAAATILLSAPPLHEEHEALPLYLHGLLEAEELLREVGR